MRIPEFLESTYSMLTESFPNGIREEYYWVILYLLYDHMADENLALVMSCFTNKPLEIIANDIYKVFRMEFDSELIEEVKSRFDECGFKEWKKAGAL